MRGKNSFKACRVGLAFAAGVVGIVGCSDDDNFTGGGVTEVVEITADDSSIPVGGGTVVRFNFSFDQNDVFFDDGEVNLVVKLPAELSYRDNSAEIDRPGSRDKDTDPRVRRCLDGESFLSFTFDESDLDDADVPFDGGDASLKLTVDGERRGGLVAIEAAADDGVVPFGCSQSFIPEEQEIISVE